MACPTTQLLDAARRLLYYLSHHRSVGLRYNLHDPQPVAGFSDSDRATKHSTSGHVILYAQAATTWSSKQQATVAPSSIVAASEAAKEAVYLRAFLAELGSPAPSVGNQSRARYQVGH
eukprot:4200367-Pleurochrysis_carterae.AAC.2